MHSPQPPYHQNGTAQFAPRVLEIIEGSARFPAVVTNVDRAMRRSRTVQRGAAARNASKLESHIRRQPLGTSVGARERRQSFRASGVPEPRITGVSTMRGCAACFSAGKSCRMVLQAAILLQRRALCGCSASSACDWRSEALKATETKQISGQPTVLTHTKRQRLPGSDVCKHHGGVG